MRLRPLEVRKGRAPFGGFPELPPADELRLVSATLWRRPDRIIVGEVRSAKAFDLVQALNAWRLGVTRLSQRFR